MKQLEEKLEAYKKEIVELVKEFKKYMEHPSNELKQDVVKQSKVINYYPVPSHKGSVHFKQISLQMIENQLRTLEKQAKKLKFNRGAAQSFTRCQRKQLRHIIFSIQNYIMVPTDILAIFSRNPNGKHCNGDSIEFN